jgi:hypothetical protein
MIYETQTHPLPRAGFELKRLLKLFPSQSHRRGGAQKLFIRERFQKCHQRALRLFGSASTRLISVRGWGKVSP